MLAGSGPEAGGSWAGPGPEAGTAGEPGAAAARNTSRLVRANTEQQEHAGYQKHFTLKLMENPVIS